MKIRSLSVALLTACFGAAGTSLCRGALPDGALQPAAELKAPGPADLAKIAEKLRPSMVVVEITAQFDKADSPGTDWNIAGAGALGGGVLDEGPSFTGWEQYIREERPAERAGYLLSPTRVLTSDPKLHPRFIKEIFVRVGAQRIKAMPAAFGLTQDAVYLDLAEPVSGGTPLVFDGSRPGPYLGAAFREQEGEWSVVVGAGAGSRVTVQPGGRKFSQVSGEILVLDREGTPVGMSMIGELGVDGAWAGSPEKWAMITEAELVAKTAGVERAADAGVLRVTLNFRSPRGEGAGGRFGGGHMAEDESPEQNVTEWNGSGLLMNDRTVLVLANYKPKVTARLEGVRVFSADGKATTGKFAGTLKDYGAFLVTLDSPLNGALQIVTAPITDQRDRLLVKAEIGVLGETRTAYYGRERLGAFRIGWRRNIYPMAPASRDGVSHRGDAGQSANFLFTLDGQLVAAPLEMRQKVAVETRGRWGGDETILIPASYISAALGKRPESLDEQNRPLSEADESRLAWLGVEMQPMDPDLARENNVVDQTGGGRTGAIVTYIYPDSPASKAGLEAGDILLRMHVKDQPKPLDVEAFGAGGFGNIMDRYWQMVDQIPEEWFDSGPKPWGSAETPLTRALTDIGFGTPFKADVFRNGKVISKDFVVEQGPPHYDSAGRFKSESSGLSVRDVTYEVRRYFQMKPEEGGVIVAKVEKGSRAAVAGIKPFEFVMSVNDQPVRNVGEFEKALAGGGELRIFVKRMTEGRTVKLKIPAAKEGKEPGKGGEESTTPEPKK